MPAPLGCMVQRTELFMLRKMLMPTRTRAAPRKMHSTPFLVIASNAVPTRLTAEVTPAVIASVIAPAAVSPASAVSERN